MKISGFFFCLFFLSENVQFLEVKCSIYLNGRVFATGFLNIISTSNPLHIKLLSDRSRNSPRLWSQHSATGIYKLENQYSGEQLDGLLGITAIPRVTGAPETNGEQTAG